jgi:hypothetical protein
MSLPVASLIVRPRPADTNTTVDLRVRGRGDAYDSYENQASRSKRDKTKGRETVDARLRSTLSREFVGAKTWNLMP